MVTAALTAVVIVAGSATALAQSIPNWSAPATWQPSAGGRTASTMDLSNPVPFIPITPCRVADTRGNGFIGQYGPPALASGANRTFTITGQCGIPSAAAAVSFNFTIVGMTTSGDLRVYPAGGSLPLVSTQNWTASTGVIANAAIVPIGSSGGITVHLDGTGSVQLIIDVNGYYSPTPANASNYLQIINNSTVWTIEGVNNSTTCVFECGIYGVVSSGWAVTGVSSNDVGVYGSSGGAGLGTAGVWGISTDAIGTYGHSDNTNGTWAESTNWDALAAFGGRDGGYLQGVRNGVIGAQTTLSGQTGGVVGVSGAIVDNYWSQAGVRGIGTYNGVFGITNSNGYAGVVGAMHDPTTGDFDSGSALGWLPTVGLYTWGSTEASGVKNFVEPHPTDPTKMIRYTSLEGNEAGTYFRGRGSFAGGQAVITVPEDFSIVTDTAGLSIQVTPIGEFASVAVVSIGLDQIVLKSSRDVEFFYTVNGVRKAYNNLQPIVANVKEFVPESADAKMPTYLSAEAQRRLISNGTYNADGTVNMSTAHRVGWTQQWENRAAQLQAQAAAAATMAADYKAAASHPQATSQP